MLSVSPTADVGAHAGQEKLLLTARETAAALSISERSLWSLTNQGAIKCVRINRSVRYARTELERFIAESQS